MIFVSLREIFIRTKSFDIEGVIALISDRSFCFLYEKHVFACFFWTYKDYGRNKMDMLQGKHSKL